MGDTYNNFYIVVMFVFYSLCWYVYNKKGPQDQYFSCTSTCLILPLSAGAQLKYCFLH